MITSRDSLAEAHPEIIVGAQRLDTLLPLLQGKRVGLVVNQTSLVNDVHLLDTLLALGVSVELAFAPEHGFRGEASAGQNIADERDSKTGVPVFSLYGKQKKPTVAQLQGVDVLVFDIQDVGARFYTYLSTLVYVMEACAEQNKDFILLDRPNPNGHYVDGPLLDAAYASFVGLHPVPIVHGMTLGEYALLARGEGWIKPKGAGKFVVIACLHYDHSRYYVLPVKPSPNLPNMKSVYLYPSLCLFEGTNISLGRGTDKPFQLYGCPDFKGGDMEFTPRSKPGAVSPPHEGKLCQGFDLSQQPLDSLQQLRRLDLTPLITAYRLYPNPSSFFLNTGFFEKLAGTGRLRKQIIGGVSEATIRASWQEDLTRFKAMRKKYLLYPDFE